MQPLIQFFYDYFIDEKKDGYLLLCSCVCLQVCNNLYDKFVMDSIKPIEMLDDSINRKYFNQAKRFYTDKPKQLQAMKAAYVLESITGKN